MGAFYPKARFLERAMHKGWGGRNPLTGLNLLQLLEWLREAMLVAKVAIPLRG